MRSPLAPLIYNVDLDRLRTLADRLRNLTTQNQPQNRNGRSWYRIENNASSGAADVYLYDMIGEWGITAADFVADLKNLGARDIDLHINCEGGEVFDGLAIYESLSRHAGNVTTYVEGIAASAASFIAQAGKRRVVARNARLMIHDAQGVTMGGPGTHREMLDLLDDLSDNIADIYAERAGGTVKAWRKAMNGDAGTWYSADAAVKAGLADEVAGKEPTKPENKATAPTAPLPKLNITELLSTVKEAVK